MDRPYEPAEQPAITPLELLEPLWRWRRPIVLGLAGVVALYALVSLGVYLTRPVSRTAKVDFRIHFDGVDQEQYPNGSPFAMTDVIASPVLGEVFSRNGLDQYMSFTDFRGAMFVYESNIDKDLMDAEYRMRLAEPRLLPVDRAKLETEYREKRAALRLGDISLRFVTNGSPQMPPDTVMTKALNDVLAVWAEQTMVTRGATKYQVQLLTPNVILKDTLNTQTMLIRYDLLRRHVNRILSQIGRLATLPGANTIRAGEEKFSLLDLRTHLEDLLEFQLNPVIRRRLVYALPAQDLEFNILYLEDRLRELERTRLTARERRGQLEGAMRTFMSDTMAAPGGGPGTTSDSGGTSVTTQLGDSFFDRLIDMAGRSGAMDYRRDLTDRIISAGEDALTVDQDIAFYQDTLRLLRTSSRSSGSLKPEDVLGHFKELQQKVLDTLSLTIVAYEAISSTNLNPRSLLYQVTGPFSVRAERTLTLGFLASMGGILLGLLLLLVVFVGITRGYLDAAARRRPPMSPDAAHS